MTNFNDITIYIVIFQHNQMDVDLLNERMRELLPYLNIDSQAIISSEVASLNEDWTSLMSNLESRRDTLAKLAALWEV